jgi:signal transduction histidine kinase
MLGDQASHSEAGKPAALQPMVFAELDLNVIAESSASSMQPLAEAAGLRLDVQLLPRLPHVIVDATAVRQIVLNLLTNAVKFTPAGGNVTLTTRYTAQGEVEIEIADTGRGMTQEDMARIKDAEPEQVSAAREGGGFGLGLPLVGALARANGAEVVPSSSEGQGTRVTVVFRRDRVVPV